MGLQKKILIAILISGVIALAMGLTLTYFQVKNVLTEAIGKDFAEIAEKSAERFDAAVKEEIHTFERLVGEPAFSQALISGDRATLNTYLKYYLKHSEEKEEHLALFIVDEKGQIIGEGKLRPGDKMDQSRERWWRVVFGGGNGKIYASDMYYDELTGRKAFDVGIPVRDQDTGRAIGGLRTIMDVDVFFRFIRESSFGETGHGMLVDSAGTPLICSILPLVEHSMNEPLIDLITKRGGGWGVAEDDAHGGKKSIIGFSPVNYLNSLGPDNLGGNKWYTFIRQAPEETFAPINKLLLKILLYESIVVITICAFGVYIVRRLLLKPIHILHDGVEKVSKGYFDHKIDIKSGDELQSLSDGFNKMGESLKGFYYNLEEKIKERTSALKASETKYRALMEQAYDAIFLVNPDTGRIIEVNLQAELLTGMSKDELVGTEYWKLYPQHMLNQAVEQFNKGVRRGFKTLHNVPIRRKDGEIAWVDISARLIGYNNVRIYHSVMKDITERKKEEEKLNMTSEQLARSTMVMLEQDTRLAAIKEEMSSLLKHINMTEVFVLLSKMMSRMFGVEKVALFEQEGGLIKCRWTHGIDSKRLSKIEIPAEGDDPIARVMRDLAVIRKGDEGGRCSIDKYLEDWIALPLRGKDRVIGALVTDTRNLEGRVEDLQSFVDIVAMVLEKDRLIKGVKNT